MWNIYNELIKIYFAKTIKNTKKKEIYCFEPTV